MELKIKITSTTKDLLDRYELEKLLAYPALPEHYFDKPQDLSAEILNSYKRMVDMSSIVSSISISDDTYIRLKTIADNYRTSFEILFNYIISWVSKCNNINTKNIDHALNDYYFLADSALTNETHRALFTKLLSEYSDSVYAAGYYENDDGELVLESNRIIRRVYC